MSKITAWLNKKFTHTRDNEGDFGYRTFLHIPVGVMIGLLDWTNSFIQLFLAYERNEDRHTKDEAWKDINGAMIGWAVGRIILVIVAVALLLHFV